jgi:peptide/nickel transport system permease protein
MPATVELALLAMVVSFLISIPIGVISAARRNTLFDSVGIIATVLGQSIPGFWLGLLLILVFSVQLNWLPTGGRGDWYQLIMPVITLTAYTSARFARLTRSTTLEVLNQDYIRTSRAKGLPETVVLFKHALRNAAIPIITVAGLQVGRLLGGAVITETIFSWPGIGRFIVQGLLNRDFPVVMVGVFLTSFIYTIMNLFVDIVYGLVNPRVRYN